MARALSLGPAGVWLELGRQWALLSPDRGTHARASCPLELLRAQACSQLCAPGSGLFPLQGAEPAASPLQVSPRCLPPCPWTLHTGSVLYPGPAQMGGKGSSYAWLRTTGSPSNSQTWAGSGPPGAVRGEARCSCWPSAHCCPGTSALCPWPQGQRARPVPLRAALAVGGRLGSALQQVLKLPGCRAWPLRTGSLGMPLVSVQQCHVLQV